jgi:putative redox protein
MKSTRETYITSNGIILPARLELPINQLPHNFVLFAHCFAKGNMAKIATIISQSLTCAGFGVLRLDMTGKGEKPEDFDGLDSKGTEPDFDAAIKMLTEKYKAPSILVGHSFGGYQLLKNAQKFNSAKAICSIATELTEPFQFQQENKPLLVFHSNDDKIVPFKNVCNFFETAPHPKSMVTLVNSDHFLSKEEDARYVGNMLSSWALRYVDIPEEKPIETDHQVGARLGMENYITEIMVGKHGFLADEPEDVGGHNFGPNPYELVSSGLAACTAMTLRMYASLKKWDLQDVEVFISHDKKHCPDCENLNNKHKKIDTFTRQIKLHGNLDEKQRERLLEIANRCPVHRTLHNPVQVESSLIE